MTGDTSAKTRRRRQGDIVADIKTRAAHQWPAVLSAVAQIPKGSLDGQHHSCPQCRGTDRFRLIDAQAGAVLCNQCFDRENGDGIAAVRWMLGLDFRSAIDLLANHLDVPTVQQVNGAPKVKTDTRPFDPIPAELQDAVIQAFCDAKPPLTLDAVKAASGFAVNWPKNYRGDARCVAWPAMDDCGNVTGHILRRANGKDFPAFQKLSARKTHMLKRSKDGLVIPGGWERVQSANVVWKVEGVPDALALFPHLPTGHAVLTNICGAKAVPPYLDPLSGKTVYVVGDADQPGQIGARRYVKELAGIANARSVRLPYTVAADNGKDVRDYFHEGGTFDRLLALAEDDETNTTAEPTDEEIHNFVEDENRWTSIKAEEGRTPVAFARRALRDYGELFLWCAEWDSWLLWDGTRWKIDVGDCGMIRLSQALSDGIWKEVADFHTEDAVDFAQKMSSPSTWKSALKAAAAMRTVPVSELDSDSMLLNCANATIDLRSGMGRPHNRADRITKLCATEFDPHAKCPTWEKFLRDIYGNSNSLVGYMQRLCGWWITGLVQEHLLHIAYGIGANGKSTLFNSLLHVLGRDYAMQAPPDLLVQKKGETHPTERADLFGMRLVIASETEGGAKMAESLVKQLTGGDRIRARRMRQDFWEFDPTHKLVLLTNHRLRIRGQDHGIWRRIRELPFTQVFEGSKVDRQLPDKLKAEAPGILRWCIEGCLAWQTDGLTPPPEVDAATAAYRTSQDVLGRFVAECCEVGSIDFECKYSDLRGALEIWCRESGENLPGAKTFAQWLEDQCFQPFRSNGRKYRGITLKA